MMELRDDGMECFFFISMEEMARSIDGFQKARREVPPMQENARSQPLPRSLSFYDEMGKERHTSNVLMAKVVRSRASLMGL